MTPTSTRENTCNVFGRMMYKLTAMFFHADEQLRDLTTVCGIF